MNLKALIVLFVIALVICCSVQAKKKKKKRKPNYYDELGVEQNATIKEIKKVFFKKIVKYHPDKNDNFKTDPEVREKFTRLSFIYDVLTTPKKRERYERGLQYGTTEYNEESWEHEDAMDQMKKKARDEQRFEEEEKRDEPEPEPESELSKLVRTVLSVTVAGLFGAGSVYWMWSVYKTTNAYQSYQKGLDQEASKRGMVSKLQQSKKKQQKQEKRIQEIKRQQEEAQRAFEEELKEKGEEIVEEIEGVYGDADDEEFQRQLEEQMEATLQSYNEEKERKKAAKKNKKQQQNSGSKKPAKKRQVFYHCYCCRKKFKTIQTYLSHCASKKHKKAYAKAIEAGTLTEEQIKKMEEQALLKPEPKAAKGTEPTDDE